jgi:two-component system, chemotaxis family, chemotaxis protein CheY
MAKKILVVDDSSAIRKMVIFSVSQSGYETAEACNGREALDKLNDERPDLIICDINMPVMDGISFLKALKGNSVYSSQRFIPVLLLTTESEGAIMEEGKKSGARAWMQKPFDPGKLIDTVKMLIQ